MELADPEGRDLPEFEPGSHVDVHVGQDMVRQYSLCGDPTERHAWRIAVLRVPGGEASQLLHQTLGRGAALDVGPPRNAFPLESAQHYVFIAGGIGITPIWPMARAAERMGASWELHFSVRDLATHPFVQPVSTMGTRARIYGSRQGQRLDVAAVLDSVSDPLSTLVYTCGPARLMEEVRASAWGPLGKRLRFESFVPLKPGETGTDTAFEIVCARSGKTFAVPADRTLLSMLDEHRVRVRRSCRQGMCGACEVRVLEGEPDHRDSLRTTPDKASDGLMRACVSRARSARLVLDI